MQNDDGDYVPKDGYIPGYEMMEISVDSAGEAVQITEEEPCCETKGNALRVMVTRRAWNDPNYTMTKYFWIKDFKKVDITRGIVISFRPPNNREGRFFKQAPELIK